MDLFHSFVHFSYESYSLVLMYIALLLLVQLGGCKFHFGWAAIIQTETDVLHQMQRRVYVDCAYAIMNPEDFSDPNSGVIVRCNVKW